MQHQEIALGTALVMLSQMSRFALAMRNRNVWLVLNKVESTDMAARMLELLGELGGRVIGQVPYVPKLAHAALAGTPLDQSLAAAQVGPIGERLEALAADAT